MTHSHSEGWPDLSKVIPCQCVILSWPCDLFGVYKMQGGISSGFLGKVILVPPSERPSGCHPLCLHM